MGQVADRTSPSAPLPRRCGVGKEPTHRHAACHAREHPGRGSQRLTDRPNGHIAMTRRAHDLSVVPNAILRWGDPVEALAPAHLPSALIAALATARTHYAER